MIIVKIVVSIKRFIARRRAAKRDAEQRANQKEPAAPNINIQNTPSNNSTPNIVLNCPPAAQQITPIYVPYPIYVNPDAYNPYARAPQTYVNNFTAPQFNPYTQPNLPPIDNYAPHMQSAPAAYPPATYESQYPATIYPDEIQYDNGIGDNCIKKYRDARYPNIICFEYTDRIRYFREDGNGNLSFVTESYK